MLRIALALIAFSLVSSPAAAARLAHPSAVVKTSEKGVTVWRGKTMETVAPPALKSAPARCASKTVVFYGNALPERRQRSQGFWSGDGLTPGMRMTRRPLTQGFYADRMAAGY